MKTFETEKHNIPEGATHYADETTVDFFAWVKFIGGDTWRLMPDSKLFNKWQCRKIDNVKPIPQTNIETPEEKEVEWVNGDKCIYQGKEWQFVSILSEYFHSTAVLFDVDTEELKQAPVDSLSKPETPQQREESEREELADTACENMFGESIQNCRPDVAATVRCMIDAGYRKESD